MNIKNYNLGKYSNIFSLISQILSSSVSILLVPIYIGIIGIDSYGIIGIFSIFQGWLVLCDFGLQNLIMRLIAHCNEISVDINEKINLSFVVYFLATGIILIVIVFWASNYIDKKFIERQHVDIFLTAICVALITSIRLYENLISGIYIAIGKKDSLNILTLITSMLRSFGVILVLLFVSKTLLAFFLWHLIVSMISIVILLKYSRNFLIIDMIFPKRIFYKFIKILNLSKNYIIFSFLSIVLIQSSRMILSTMVSVSDFGYYYFSSNIASALLIFLPPCAQIVFPKFCHHLARDNFKDLKILLHQYSQFITILFGSLSITLLFFIEPILSVWTGNKILVDNTADVIKILLIGNLFAALTFIPYQLQLADDGFHIMVLIGVVSIAFSIPVTIFLVSKYSVIGAALSWTTLNVFQFIFCTKFMISKKIGFELKKWYVNDTAILLAAILIANMIAYYSFPVSSQLLFLALHMAFCLVTSSLAALFFSKYLRSLLSIIILKTFIHN